jgi:hypothetical protein
MKREPPGMKGTQYGSGWENSYSSALPSYIVCERDNMIMRGCAMYIKTTRWYFIEEWAIYYNKVITCIHAPSTIALPWHSNIPSPHQIYYVNSLPPREKCHGRLPNLIGPWVIFGRVLPPIYMKYSNNIYDGLYWFLTHHNNIWCVWRKRWCIYFSIERHEVIEIEFVCFGRKNFITWFYDCIYMQLWTKKPPLYDDMPMVYRR